MDEKTITVLPDLPLLFGCGSSDRQWNDGVKYAPRWKKNQWQFQVSKLEVSTIIFLAHLIGLCKGIYYIYPPIYIWLYMGQYLHFGSWNSPLAWQPKFHSFLSWNLGRSFWASWQSSGAQQASIDAQWGIKYPPSAGSHYQRFNYRKRD